MNYDYMTILKIIGKTLLFIILTILTQIGGIIYLLSLLISTKIKFELKEKS